MFPYIFMKEYESKMQNDQERRGRQLPDERINLCLTYDYRKSGLHYWGSGPNSLSISHKHSSLRQMMMRFGFGLYGIIYTDSLEKG